LPPPASGGSAAPLGREPLPPLTLPPDIPLAPSPERSNSAPAKSNSATARYRPTPSEQKLASAFPLKSPVQVTLRIRQTPPSPGGYRLVRFLNYTDHAVVVHIEGYPVQLPPRSQVPVWTGSALRWCLLAEAEQQLHVPEGAGGVDVVLRSPPQSGDPADEKLPARVSSWAKSKRNSH
jgi:hypothetical protein